MKSIFFCLIILLSLISDLLSQTVLWRLLPNSPSPGVSTRFEDIFFINENTGWIINIGGSTFKTTNAGQSWNNYPNIPLNRSVGFFDSQTGIIGTLDTAKALYRTSNGGVNWVLINNLPSPKPKGICGISIVNENMAYVVGTYYGFARAYRTTDKGLTWSIVFNDASLARSLVDVYFWSPDSGLIAGGYNISDYSNGNSVVLLTTNGGTNWTRVYRSTRTGEWCWKISFLPGSRMTGYASIERHSGFSYIIKTTNGGSNWMEIPFMDYDQEGIGFVNENTGWIGGWGGPTYETTNGGNNWHIAGWGLLINRFRFLNDTLGYAVGDRVYKYSGGTIGVHTSSEQITDSYRLFQNYPNPFNPSTTIKFEIPKKEFVSLKIFDALGNEIESSYNKLLNAGTYDYNFNAAGLSSGVYFYKLITDKVVYSKSMLLIK